MPLKINFINPFLSKTENGLIYYLYFKRHTMMDGSTRLKLLIHCPFTLVLTNPYHTTIDSSYLNLYTYEAVNKEQCLLLVNLLQEKTYFRSFMWFSNILKYYSF